MVERGFLRRVKVLNVEFEIWERRLSSLHIRGLVLRMIVESFFLFLSP